MNRISCLIFDLDGTLGQTNDLIFATFNHVANKFLNKSFTREEIIGLFGPPEEVALARIVGKDRIEQALNELYRYYEEHHLDLARLHPGVETLLDHLKQQGFHLAIFTGKGRRTTSITVEKFGIRKYFDMIVTGSDVTNHKPSSDGIRKVMKMFSLRPEEVLMVGDAVSDVKAAREAGVKIAAVLWDSYAKTKVLEMEVDYVFHTVEDFDSWIRKLTSPTLSSGT